MTYKVSSETLNLCSLTNSCTAQCAAIVVVVRSNAWWVKVRAGTSRTRCHSPRIAQHSISISYLCTMRSVSSITSRTYSTCGNDTSPNWIFHAALIKARVPVNTEIAGNFWNMKLLLKIIWTLISPSGKFWLKECPKCIQSWLPQVSFQTS